MDLKSCENGVEKPKKEVLKVFLLRLPAGVYNEVKDRAKNNFRSLNGQIVFELGGKDGK